MRALPDFPWDQLGPLRRAASAYPGGIVDLSVGTPVDPTPAVVQAALREAADAPGYPQAHGSPVMRQAVVDWFDRRRGVAGLDPAGVMATVGSKELVALLPTLLGLGGGDAVVLPTVAYPTYDVGARMCGALPVAHDHPETLPATVADPAGGTARIRLLWLNSPSNPTGRVLTVDRLAAIVAWARANDVVIASDECYAELGWDDRPVPSLLDPAVTGGSTAGLLVAYSLSKQSNLAGYRAAFVAGDPLLVDRVLQVRRHLGLMMPWPVQQACAAALGDDAHVAEQKERYRGRRDRLAAACAAAGLRHDGGPAGLYLWVTREGSVGDRDGSGPGCWRILERLAGLGILAAPGVFYGQAGAAHVRIALTATDAAVDLACERLASA